MVMNELESGLRSHSLITNDEQRRHFFRAIDRYRLHEPLVERLRMRGLETKKSAYQQCDADRAPSLSHR